MEKIYNAQGAFLAIRYMGCAAMGELITRNQKNRFRAIFFYAFPTGDG